MVIQETVVGIIVRLFINQSWSEFVQTADGIENTKVQLSLSHCLSAAERNLMTKMFFPSLEAREVYICILCAWRGDVD